MKPNVYPWEIEIPQELIDSFAEVRKRIQKAVDSCPKHVTFEEAKEQICRFQKSQQKP